MISQTNHNKKFEIKKSIISGSGVFTKIPIKKGQRVHIIRGKKMSTLQMFKAVDHGLENSADPLLIGEDLYLDLDELSRTFNHSCNPNLFIRGSRTLVAIRNIKLGDELTYNYSTTMIDGDKIKSLGHPVWSCKCKCRSVICTGRVDQFDRLPKRRQSYFIRNRYAPTFVLKKFRSKFKKK